MMDGFHPPNEMNVDVWIWPHWMNFHGMNVVQYTNMTTSIWDEILWIKVNFTSITKIYGWILWSWRRETFVNFNCWVNFNHYTCPSSLYTTLTQWPFLLTDCMHPSIIHPSAFVSSTRCTQSISKSFNVITFNILHLLCWLNIV